jgi:fatty acid desaturase
MKPTSQMTRSSLSVVLDLFLLLTVGPLLVVLWLCFELVMLVGWFPLLMVLLLGWASRQAWEHRADQPEQSIQVEVGE